MLSMSGAILRFSWFISNSYSKSEIARRPLTIAVAPCSRAKSTRSVSKAFTCTLPKSWTSASMNSTRSAAGNTGVCLRTGWFTTPTTTLSNTSAARLMMSTWPSVTGSYVPGQIAVPFLLFGTVDGDAGVAVVAFVDLGEVELERRALVGFGDDHGVGREHTGKVLGEQSSGAVGGIIW